MQLDLIDEEYHEFRNAFYNEPYEDELKELADLVYVCFQYAENMEWDLEEALDRVHRSNMSKLGLDGTPIRRADGKVLKGPNYQPPVLKDLKKAIHYLENELHHTTLHIDKSERSSNSIPFSVWDPEQCGQPDYATGFDR